MALTVLMFGFVFLEFSQRFNMYEFSMYVETTTNLSWVYFAEKPQAKGEFVT